MISLDQELNQGRHLGDVDLFAGIFKFVKRSQTFQRVLLSQRLFQLAMVVGLDGQLLLSPGRNGCGRA